MRFLSTLIIFTLITLSISSCDKKEDPKPPVNGPDTTSFELKIYSFKFDEFTPAVVGEIDSANLEISALIPKSADITKLTPTIEYTDGASITPPEGFAYNFSQPLNFQLEKKDSVVTYSVTVGFAVSTDNDLLKVIFPELGISKEVTETNIQVEFLYGTDLTDVLIDLQTSDYTTTIPESPTRVDLSNPINISVFAENGDEKVYTLEAFLLPQETAVRAFWVPAPWHSQFLQSYENIQAGVALAKELKFNTLYIGAWAQNKILYPSQTLLDNSSYTNHNEALFWNYTGGSGDPLTDVVSVAHANNIKVILWYEYGFMARVGSTPTPQNNPILAEHPDWVGINVSGTESNYNGSDFYYNAYSNEVQQFMINIMMEAVNNYDIDGIQGDDRMPAMPRNSGYDTYTVNKYKSEHGGQEPPLNINDADWVRWRADILNSFWQDVYDTVKAVKPNCLVTCSPNPYPWAFDNLMQEWPAWLDDGTVEILSPQCYRSSESSYKYTLEEVIRYFTQHGSGDLTRLVPGVLLYGSNGLTDPELLRAQMRINRENGVFGESFFYDVPLKNESIQNVIKSFYIGEAKFPEF